MLHFCQTIVDFFIIGEFKNDFPEAEICLLNENWISYPEKIIYGSANIVCYGGKIKMNPYWRTMMHIFVYNFPL